MFIRRLKKKCGVRGCRNIESFAIARTKSEMGNMFICEQCLADALSGVAEAKKIYAERQQANKVSSPPPLFYNPVVEKAVEEPAAVIEEVESETNEEDSEAEETSEKCICTECGKEFDTEKGLNMHKRIHDKE